MRLCLDLRVQDIAYRFSIAKSTVVTIFNAWIDVMAIRLQFLIKWSPKEIIQASMPQIFNETYPLTQCITDCSEILSNGLSFQACAKTYSENKRHNTATFLIAISPAGTILLFHVYEVVECLINLSLSEVHSCDRIWENPPPGVFDWG